MKLANGRGRILFLPPHACRQSSSLLYQPSVTEPQNQYENSCLFMHAELSPTNMTEKMTWLASRVQLSLWLPIHQGYRNTQSGIHHSCLPYVMKVSPSKATLCSAGNRHAQENQTHLILQAVLQVIQCWKIQWFQFYPLNGALPLIWEYYFRGRYGLSVSIKFSGGKPIPMGTISFLSGNFRDLWQGE